MLKCIIFLKYACLHTFRIGLKTFPHCPPPPPHTHTIKRAPYKAPSAEFETISNHLSWKNIHYDRHVELL